LEPEGSSAGRPLPLGEWVAPLIRLLRLLGRLPLAWYHAAGAALGWIVYRTSPRFANRLRDNLRASGVCADEAEYRRVLRENIRHTGMQAVEFVPLWFRSQAEAAALVRRCTGEDAVREAYESGRGVILLTPHLGCFEVSAIYTAQRAPITVLYRQPHVKFLDRLILAGRARGQEKLAPANLRGVRALLRALKAGECIGVLPDQVPGEGEGVWVDFFGRRAYTMTLIGKLCEFVNPKVFIAVARRLPDAAGFEIEVAPVEGDLTGAQGARRMNQAIEAVIRKYPEQYLWAYNRYKHPAGAPLPPVEPQPDT
jgi:KDO2-lipid IV(A) lauroyltransferase